MGGRVEGTMDTCVCTDESFCCSLKTISTLLIGCIPIQKLCVIFFFKENNIVLNQIDPTAFCYSSGIVDIIGFVIVVLYIYKQLSSFRSASLKKKKKEWKEKGLLQGFHATQTKFIIFF